MRFSDVRRRAAAAWLIGGLVLAPDAPAEEVAALALSAGSFDAFEGDEGEGGIAWRGAPRAFGLAPEIGAAGTVEGAFYAFAGVRREVGLGSRWVVTPGLAFCLYEDGDGKDLGGPVEFRSSLELARRLGAASRLGLAVYHLSNAGIYDHNPGSNSLILVYSLGLGSRSRAAD